MAATRLKQLAVETISCRASELQRLSSDIWSHPEVAFLETHAHRVLTDFLEERGFHVERSFGLPTAFRATYSDDRGPTGPMQLNVGVMCEYDALPTIGHACGHNLIAEAGVAAGLGIQAALLASPGRRATVTVLGCPAEEGEGGKIEMIEKGCFAGLDCAMMVHPFTENAVDLNALARAYLRITFTVPQIETPLHSSSDSPEEGGARGRGTSVETNQTESETIAGCLGVPCTSEDAGGPNPVDAAVLAYSSLSMLRQQLKPTWLIHGIVSDGGRPSLSPPLKAELLFYFRTPTHRELLQLLERATACFNSAAQSTGCLVEITEKAKTYKNVISNPTLAGLFLRNSQEVGTTFSERTENFSASTDMGNVSHLLPSLHPLYAIGSPAVNHTREFTAASNTLVAHTATLSAAKVLAMTAVDLLCDLSLVQQVRAAQ